MSEVKGPAWLGSGDSARPGWETPTSPRSSHSEGDRQIESQLPAVSSYEVSHPVRQAPPSQPPLNAVTSPRPTSNAITPGASASTHERGGGNTPTFVPQQI